jgi:AcrR family transcriptional regulator
MPRPSQNTDQRLIHAARRLLPETGCEGLKLRQVASRAKVNLGMFHYHFKTKDEFLRRVLQEVYEEFFRELQLEASQYASPRENLQAAMTVFGNWVRDNRRLIFALLRDAMNGQRVAQEFLRANLHRHIEILLGLIRQCRAQGLYADMAPANLLVTLIAAANMPTVLTELLRRAPNWPQKAGFMLIVEAEILSDAAIAGRIAHVLRTPPTREADRAEVRKRT